MANTTAHPPNPRIYPPQSELNEFLADLAEQSEVSWRQQQAQVVQDVKRDCDEAILAQLTESGILLARLVEQWNRRLRLSLRQDVPPERILCGFNALADVVYQLDADEKEPETFIKWVARQQGEDSSTATIVDAAQQLAKDSPSFREVKTPLEMLAALLQAMERPNEEWKPHLAEVLWEKEQEYVYGRPKIFRMGGASGNMAYVLSQLGIDTTVHWLYHAEEIASDVPERLQRLLLDGGGSADAGIQLVNATAAQPDDPVRRSFVFDFTKELSLSGSSDAAQDNGRVIFIIIQYLADVARSWKRLMLRTTAPTGEQMIAELENTADVLGENGWPFFPVFASKRVEEDALVVELVSDHVMEQVATRFDYFMLGGIQSIGYELHRKRALVDGRPSQPTAHTIIKHALMRQLDILTKRGVVIHWEIGGISSPQLLDDLADVAGGRVKNAGLNDGELRGMTGDVAFRHTRFFFRPLQQEPQAEDILTRYDRAVHLARQLDLDELYVHGNDVDLIVRRRATRGALRQEVAVTLFAKGVVMLTLLQRSVPDWKESIRDGRISVPPVLKADGFIALLRLAKGLAMRRFASNKMLELRTFANIARLGYYYEQNPDDYSVMVVPVMWPELNIPFSTAGAGDVTSSVVAVYAGK